MSELHVEIVDRSQHRRFPASEYMSASESMGNLLAKAGMAGTFEAHFHIWKAGSAHTKGLRLLSPHRQCVQLSYQYGDNSTCAVFGIHPPADMDRDVFHARLREAIHLEETGEEPPAHNATDVLMKILGDEPTSLSLAKAPDEPVAPPVHDERKNSRFISDPEKVELFMLELQPHLQPDGSVDEGRCKQILIKDFGIAERGVHHSIYALIGRGKLRRGVGGRLIVCASEAVLPQETAASVDEPKSASSSNKGMQHKIAELEAKAGEVTGHKLRLSKIDQQLAELSAERAEVERQLTASQDADGRLAEIRRLLGSE